MFLPLMLNDDFLKEFLPFLHHKRSCKYFSRLLLFPHKLKLVNQKSEERETSHLDGRLARWISRLDINSSKMTDRERERKRVSINGINANILNGIKRHRDRLSGEKEKISL